MTGKLGETKSDQPASPGKEVPAAQSPASDREASRSEEPLDQQLYQVSCFVFSIPPTRTDSRRALFWRTRTKSKTINLFTHRRRPLPPAFLNIEPCMVGDTTAILAMRLIGIDMFSCFVLMIEDWNLLWNSRATNDEQQIESMECK